ALDFAIPERPERQLAFDEALDRLSVANPRAAELVKLRYFAGFSGAEAASLLGISPRMADQVWAYARAWLLRRCDCRLVSLLEPRWPSSPCQLLPALRHSPGPRPCNSRISITPTAHPS